MVAARLVITLQEEPQLLQLAPLTLITTTMTQQPPIAAPTLSAVKYQVQHHGAATQKEVSWAASQ